MNNFKIISLICLIYVVFSPVMSQNFIEKTNEKDIDYLSYKYKYLDKKYAIKIKSSVFSKGIEKYNFHPNRLKTYIDSLGVIMMLEFDDWQKCNRAIQVIGFSWKRLGYYTWQSEQEIKTFSESFGIRHPWRMYEILTSDSKNFRINEFYDNLKAKLFKIDLNLRLEKLSNKQILFLALKMNPKRMADVQKDIEKEKKEADAYLKKHGTVDPQKLGVGCDKPNCCQKPIVTKKITQQEKSIY